MTDFHRDSTVKATRKLHHCEHCGTAIEIGSPAHYSVGSYYGDFYRSYQHVECRAAGMAYAEMTDCWGEDFMWFQHNLDEREDKLWLLEEHPIVAERLGLPEWLAEQEVEAAE
jgi:rRNA maturation protein Nop10